MPKFKMQLKDMTYVQCTSIIVFIWRTDFTQHIWLIYIYIYIYIYILYKPFCQTFSWTKTELKDKCPWCSMNKSHCVVSSNQQNNSESFPKGRVYQEKWVCWALRWRRSLHRMPGTIVWILHLMNTSPWTKMWQYVGKFKTKIF